MAKAQLENGFTQIATELLEKICIFKMTQNELKVLLAIVRLSYGWRQKDTANRAGIRSLEKITGLQSNQIYIAVKSLQAGNVIITERNGRNKYSINTDCDGWRVVTNHDQSQSVTSHKSRLVTNRNTEVVTNHDYGVVTNHDYGVVTNHDYGVGLNQSSDAAVQTPKYIKDIKYRKDSETLPSDYYQKTLNALGLPATGVLSPKDIQALTELFKVGCNFEDIEQARIKRKKNRLEWIQDTVCEMRDARTATIAKPDRNGIPILPNGCMDWDNMTFEQKEFAMQRGYEK